MKCKLLIYKLEFHYLVIISSYNTNNQNKSKLLVRNCAYYFKSENKSIDNENNV